MQIDRRNFLVGAMTTGVLGVSAGTATAQMATSAAAPARADWLIDPSSYVATITHSADGREVTMSNGLLRRVFRLSPNAVTASIDNLMTGESELRSVRPEASITINDYELDVGGLLGLPLQNYFVPEWLDQMTADPRAFQFDRVEQGRTVERFPWKRVPEWTTEHLPWPPPGVSLTFHYKPGPQTPVKDVAVRVHYEFYDGIPLMAKWIELDNNGSAPIIINSFKAEILAFVESYYGSLVDGRPAGLTETATHFHVETDYAFGGTMKSEHSNAAVHWKGDPQFHGGAFSLLECTPDVGPELEIAPKETWRSFTVFELLHDSKETERRGLAIRKMMKTLAPWVMENPLYMHIRYAEPDKVKFAIDQCVDVGFEMVMLSFGSGFDIENKDPKYLAQMKDLADYAKQKGIAIGGYTLLANRGGAPEDLIINVKTGKPGGGTFGPSPCLCTKWADDFFETCRNFLTSYGMNVYLNDGSYPGDFCASTTHAHHKGYLDSQWKQWKVITKMYRWCREQGYYLKVPDWYFLNGSNKTAMPYNEFDWSLPRQFQTVIERQYIYDGTYEKTPSMGWMHVPLVEYHSGGEAATVEPLHDNLAHYETRFADLLGAGVQATWRGTRLYDTDETRLMVKKWVDLYKKHRVILDSDIIHLRRPDGNDWDGILHVNPRNETRGMAFLYNPTDKMLTRTIELPLYYTGLTEKASIQVQDAAPRTYTLDRDFKVSITLEVPAQSRTWLQIKKA